MFTRLWVLCSIALFRLWPLLALWLYARHHAIAPMAWPAAFGLTLLLLVIAQVSAARCSSEQLPHTHGLFVIGAAMSTGWSYLDLMLVPLSVTLALCLTVLLALLPGAPARYFSLVKRVADHRMQQ
ncbi:hypothetical protein [Pseudoxanthomonas sp.]|uniref:hypothetical protein n=1 Tax=Pseudoxanthomonas sp. TaxID=1871049 RepID=UPI002639B0FC|nr:hypothetical protein [Pseudoxanthomonas sp.]WDS35725.1 MAG: hypothetical protein O8I58_15565 [Pseudoxanthomonas sp.]